MGGLAQEWVRPRIVTHGTNKGGPFFRSEWANNAHKPFVKGRSPSGGVPLHIDVFCS